MSGQINPYGDKLVPTDGHHGADIASQRIDDLDRECLVFAAQTAGTKRVVIDVGTGLGSFGFRLAALGYKTFAYDIIAESELIKIGRNLGGFIDIEYVQSDINQSEIDYPNEIYICYSQRTIHYLKNTDAISFLVSVRKKMTPDAKLFLSASGLHSELGVDYNVDPIECRFSKISLKMQSKHEIRDRVCLYTLEELQTTCEKSGFKVDKIWQSAFGNIKIICSK